MELFRQEYRSGLPCPPPGDRTQVSCLADRFFAIWYIYKKSKKRVLSCERGDATGYTSERIALSLGFQGCAIKHSGASITLRLSASLVLDTDRGKQMGDTTESSGFINAVLSSVLPCIASPRLWQVETPSGYPASNGIFFFNRSILDWQYCVSFKFTLRFMIQ